MTILYINDRDLRLATYFARDKEAVKKWTAGSDVLTKPLAALTLVADSDSELKTIAGKTPEALAAECRMLFHTQDKNELRQVYLLSKFAGMTNETSTSLAQRFAKAMHTQGFLNLTVHAVANSAVSQLSKENYKDELNLEINTFLPTGVKVAMSPYVVIAIHYLLEAAKTIKVQKSIDYIKTDIAELKNKPTLGSEEIITLLTRGRSARQKNTSDYYKHVLSGLKAKLRDSTIEVEAALPPAGEDILAQSAKNEIEQSKLHENGGGPGYFLARTNWSGIGGRAAPESAQVAFFKSKAQLQISTGLEEAAQQLAAKGSSGSDIKALDSSKNGTSSEVVDIDVEGEEALPSSPTVFLGQTLSHKGKNNDEITGSSVTAANGLLDKDKLSQDVVVYMTERRNEWGFHYNFFGMVAVCYLILDFFTGSDRFNSKSREVKLQAANKLVAMIDDNQSVAFTRAEQKALKDGRLGKIVLKHGGLDRIMNQHEASLVQDNAPLAHSV